MAATLLLLLGGVTFAAAHAGCAHEHHSQHSAPPSIAHADYGEHPFELLTTASPMAAPDDLTADERPRAAARARARRAEALNDDVAANNEVGQGGWKTDANAYASKEAQKDKSLVKPMRIKYVGTHL